MDLPVPWLYEVMNGCLLVAYVLMKDLTVINIHYRSASSLSVTFNELVFTHEGTCEEGYMWGRLPDEISHIQELSVLLIQLFFFCSMWQSQQLSICLDGMEASVKRIVSRWFQVGPSGFIQSLEFLKKSGK